MLGKLANKPVFRLPLQAGTPLGSSAELVEGPAIALAWTFRFLRNGAVTGWLDSVLMVTLNSLSRIPVSCTIPT